MNNKLNDLIKIKSQNIKSDLEKEKLDLILELIKEKDCFFKMSLETAIGILEFLDVKDNDILSFYQELISYKNYQENVPMERIDIINNE